QVPELLAIERILVNATRNLTPLLHKYNASFGGTYIDVKANKIMVKPALTLTRIQPQLDVQIS
ncbi:24526_t:CDS:2, partial [Racocetra persica]